MLCQLASDFHSMDRMHIVALLCDYLTKRRHHGIKIFVILLWLSPYDIDHCLQLSNLNSLKKMADFNAIIDITGVMIHKSLHNCVLFLVECNKSHHFFSPSSDFCSFFSVALACLEIWSGPRNQL